MVSFLLANTVPIGLPMDEIKMVIIVLLSGSVVVELFPPIHINPWTWILRGLGKRLNQEVTEQIGSLESSVADLSTQVDELKQADVKMKDQMAEGEIIAARRRIIKFAEELRIHEDYLFSHEIFDDVLTDITNYKRYCEEHPLFENEKAVFSIRFVEDAYRDNHGYSDSRK